MVEKAIKYGYLDGPALLSNIDSDIRTGSLDKIKLYPIKKAIQRIEIAVYHGSLDIVKYLIENNAIITSTIFNTAVLRGSLDIVKYLIENDHTVGMFVVSEYVMGYAAANDYMDIVKYFVRSNIKTNEEAIQWAVYHNLSEMVDYLFFNGAPYNKNDIDISRFQNIYIDLLKSFIIDDIILIIVSYLI